MFERISLSTWLLALLMLATLVFGIWGWTCAGVRTPDSIYLSVTAFVLSDTYEFLGGSETFLDEDKTIAWNWMIEAARWTGMSAFLLGASKAVLLFFSDTFARARARWRSGHILVIGDSAVATVVTHAARQKGVPVNWLAASKDNHQSGSKHFYIQKGDWALGQAKRYGLTRAKKAMIAFGDDAKSIAIARQIRAQVPDENKLKIYLSVNELWLAMRIDELEGVAGIRVVSEPEAAVRRIHRRHPPFLIAKNSGHPLIHIVIVGFGRWGEAVLVDSLLSCATSYLGKPRFTIIDPCSDSIQRSLKIRYPELDACADITFINKAISDTNNCLDSEEIYALGATNSVTACYVCLPDESTSLSAGMALHTAANRAAWACGPIFVRLSTPGSLSVAPAGVKRLGTAQLVAFGESTGLAEETGILSENTDGLAKALHEAYRKAGSSDRESAVPWESLPEDKRDSNRRVAMHLPAKLSSAGIDIEPWLQTLDAKPELDNLPEVESLFATDEELEKLAELEHDRWMVDRRINGWSYNTERDDKRRFHPDLIPFEQLSEKSKSYDREVVETLAGVLAKKRN